MNVKDKIVLITGATSGIGKVAAIELAKMGAHVVIHGRDERKARIVRDEIVSICGHENIEILIGDVSSMQDVKTMAKEFLSRFDRLDILINNAGGVMDAKRQLTVDGLERTFAVNVASLFLLTALLFDALTKSSEARIINVSSMAHKFARPDWSDFQLERKYSSNLAYGNAKLYVICVTEELDRRMKEKRVHHVSVNALHPGVVATNFAKESKGSMMNLFFKILRPFLITPEKGARTTVYLASSEEVKGISGKYFAKCRPASIKRTFISEENSLKLWQKLEQLTGKDML